MLRIVNSQDICKALHYTDADFLAKPDIDDPSKIIYHNVFPFRKIPRKTDSDLRSYLTLHFGGYRPVSGGFYKSGKIYLNAVVHIDCMSTEYGILRTDYIIGEIDKLFNDERGIGIGKIKFFGMDDTIINDQYVGTQIVYELTEFN